MTACCLVAELAFVFVVVRWTSPTKSVEVSAMFGVAYVAWIEGNAASGDLNGMPPGLFVRARLARPMLWPPGGRFYWKARTPMGNVVHGVLFPFWVPALGAAVPMILLWRGDGRRLPAHCPECGYDLTGGPAGPCPECGASRTALTTSA